MADTTQEQREQYEHQQEQQRSQSTFDSLFSAQIGQIDPSGREAWQAYFELAEQTLRTARRVSEIQVLSLMQGQIVKQVTSQVINQLQQNPQLLKQPVQQVMSQK